jgi:hypothetical protein
MLKHFWEVIKTLLRRFGSQGACDFLGIPPSIRHQEPLLFTDLWYWAILQALELTV